MSPPIRGYYLSTIIAEVKERGHEATTETRNGVTSADAYRMAAVGAKRKFGQGEAI
jgi:hypothetical protein